MSTNKRLTRPSVVVTSEPNKQVRHCDSLSRSTTGPEANKVAIDWCGHQLTYSQLESSVVRLADRIAALGAARSNVLVMGPLSPAYVVGLLATWRAEAVPVPVDAGLTAAQYEWLERSTRPALVISNDATPVDHHQTSAVNMSEVVMDSVTGRVIIESNAGKHGPRSVFGDPDAGYVIPTSGSTGEPKAIVGSHRGLEQFFDWFLNEFAFAATDRCAAITRVNFDPSLRELLGVLSVGGTLFLPPVDAQLDLSTLAQYLVGSQPTVLFLVPSLAIRLAEQVQFTADRLPSLRLIFFAGEVLRRQVVEKWAAIAPNAEVVNLYGQTEATLAQLYRRNVQHFDHDATLPIPVGKPRPGITMKIVDLDQSGSGEVLLTSEAPALGVLNADLTLSTGVHQIESFDTPRHTGDLGCSNADGELVIVGRCGNDIKFGGRKVSFHAFTDAVEAIPAVKQCVVVDLDGPQVFVETAHVDTAVSDALRAEITAIAADLELPGISVQLRLKLPILRSGKVDRRALLASLSGGTVGDPIENTTIPHDSNVEQTIRSQLRIGGEANGFADAGVSSLQMLDVATRIIRSYGVRLSVDECFALADIPSLVGEIERRRQFQDTSPTAPVIVEEAVRSTGIYPLSSRQLAYMWVCMSTGNANWCNLSREIRVDRRLSRSDASMAFQTLFTRHDALGLSLTANWKDQNYTSAAGLSCSITFEDTGFDVNSVEFQTHAQFARAKFVSALIDPTTPPPVRALVMLATDGCSVFLVAHHLFVDGLGMDVLADELRELLSGRDLGPIESCGSYREYCVATARPEHAGESATYWRNMLSGVRQIRLPESTDAGSVEGELISLPLGVVCSRAVHRIARELGVSSFTVVLAAFEMAVAETFGLDRLAIIVPSQIRGDVSGASVGMFMSQLVIRGEGSQSLAQNTSALVRQLVDGAAKSDWEFDQRVIQLGLEESDCYPLSTVLFNQRVTRRGLRVRDLGAWVPRSLGRSLRYQLQGELQMSGPEMVMTYYYRRGIAGAKAEMIMRVHRNLIQTIRKEQYAHDAALRYAAVTNSAESKELV